MQTTNVTWQANAATVARGAGFFSLDDVGNIYIGDWKTYSVRKWAQGAPNGVIVAGGNGLGNALNQVNEFDGVCSDNAGNVYISDWNNARVEKWAPGATTGTIVAGGNGVGSAANQLNSIFSIYVDAAGNLYVDDGGNDRVQIWPPGATQGITVAGGNGRGSALNQLNSPEAMYVDPAGNIYILDNGNGRVVEWTPGATAGIAFPITYGFFESPEGIYVDALGNVYLPYEGMGIVVEWPKGASNYIIVAGDPDFIAGSGSNDLWDPGSVYIDNSGFMYVGDNGNYRVQKFTPKINKTITAISPGLYTATITTFSGQTATASFEVDPFASVTIASNIGNNICAGQAVTFNATTAGGGPTPFYQWQINGVNSGMNNPALSNSVLNENDQINCILTPSLGCTEPVNSNVILMTVNTRQTPEIIISSSATSICKGANVSFNAVAVNGGDPVIYQWKLNGSNVGDNSGTYENSSLNNGDVLSCTMQSSESCLTNASATSNIIQMDVSASILPSIAISSSSMDICQGSDVKFTAEVSNGGSTPSLQWQVNGVNSGDNNTVYESSSWNNEDKINCILTSSLTCAANQNISSNIISLNVTPNSISEVTISTPSDFICDGTTAIFNATPMNGGLTPGYQWKLNGVNTGSNGPVYTNGGLENGDVISCIMTSSEKCVSDAIVSSQAIRMQVNPNLAPAVIISASALEVCADNSITFHATPINGGGKPLYQWYINGAMIAENDQFSTSKLANGDVINCQMTSDESCLQTQSALSNNLSPTIKPTTPSSVSIEASTTDICSGTEVTFSASTETGGLSLAFQWQINGLDVGENSPSYKSGMLKDGDLVNCILTSSINCVLPSTSPGALMTVRPTPEISLNASDTVLLYGQEAQLNVKSDVNIVDYTWSPENSLSSATIEAPIAKPETTTSYQVTATSDNGCKANASILIKVYHDLRIPNAFTPNNDGKNDIFRIPWGIEVKLNDFLIFDRWGNKIFQTTDPNNGWDGNFKGQACPSGTYVYLIDCISGNHRLSLKGTVILVR